MRERFPLVVRRLIRPHLLGLRARTEPVDDRWGYDRGTPIDRWYIERFLEAHRADIRGRALEVKDDGYVRRFGSDVDHVDVLDVDPANARATVRADLETGEGLPDEPYDCFVLTQTLQYIRDPAAAVRHAHRLLAPGGVLLVTVPSITRMTLGEPGLVDYWRFTEASCRALFDDVFGPARVTVESHGNLAASAAFLAGYALEELGAAERDRMDERFPLVVCVRATRA